MTHFQEELIEPTANSAHREDAASLQFGGLLPESQNSPRVYATKFRTTSVGTPADFPVAQLEDSCGTCGYPTQLSGELCWPPEDRSLLASVGWLRTSLAWGSPADLSTI